MAITEKDLPITQGDTFNVIVRWENGDLIVRKPITGISFASGAPRFTANGHGCVNGWRAHVALIKGPTQLNAQNNPPRGSDYHPATFVDADTVEFNDITAVDDNGRALPAWTEGGFLIYNAPVDMTGYTARMTIRDKLGGTVLASTDPLDAPLDVLTITIDNTAKTILLSIEATDTDDLAWKTGVYDLEMVSATGKVTKIMRGKVTVSRESTK